MNEQIKQIAERLRGLRDVLELTAEDIARDSDISAEEYRLAETGDYDISVSMLQKIARTYNVALDALMFGEEPKMSSYFVTRAGKGISIERTKAYKYQSLASGFAGTVPPIRSSLPLNRKQSTSRRSIITNIMDRNSTLSSKDVCLSTSKAKKSSSIKETVFILTLNFHMA